MNEANASNYQPFYLSPDLLGDYGSMIGGGLPPLSDWGFMNDEHKFANGIVFIDSLTSSFKNNFKMDDDIHYTFAPLNQAALTATATATFRFDNNNNELIEQATGGSRLLDDSSPISQDDSSIVEYYPSRVETYWSNIDDDSSDELDSSSAQAAAHIWQQFASNGHHHHIVLRDTPSSHIVNIDVQMDSDVSN